MVVSPSVSARCREVPKTNTVKLATTVACLAGKVGVACLHFSFDAVAAS